MQYAWRIIRVTPPATTAVHKRRGWGLIYEADTKLSKKEKERDGRKVLTTRTGKTQIDFIAKKKAQAAVKKVGEGDDVVGPQRERWIKRRKQAKNNSEPAPATCLKPAVRRRKVSGALKALMGGKNDEKETKLTETYRGRRGEMRSNAEKRRRRSDLQTFHSFFVINVFT